jgi:hypothetical protein
MRGFKSMPIVSLTRDIKLTNEGALKIINSKPSEKLQAILESSKSQGSVSSTENKLISKYV